MKNTRKSYTLAILRHSGTHLIKPILKNLVGPAKGGKGPTLLDGFVVQGPLVVCLRDPRSRVVSALRWKYGKLLKPGSVKADKCLAEYIESTKAATGMTILEFMHAWADLWANRAEAHYVRFESLVAAEKHAIRTLWGVTKFLERDVTRQAVAEAYHRFYKSVGWSGRHSQPKEWFGPRAIQAWNNGGGAELLEKMGYK